MQPVTLYLTITSTTPSIAPDPLPVETGSPIPSGQAEMSPTEKARIAVRRADEAKIPIYRKNTWKEAVSRIKLVMDTVSQVVEVRPIFVLPLLY